MEGPQGFQGIDGTQGFQGFQGFQGEDGSGGGASVAIDDAVPTGIDTLWYQPSKGIFNLLVDGQWINLSRNGLDGEDGTSSFIFPIWAEENSTLEAALGYEWAFGNGANTPSNSGLMMSVPPGYTCSCYAMSIKMANTTGSATIELMLNEVAQGSNCNVVATANGGTVADVNGGTPLPIADGDIINFRTTSSSGTTAPSVVTAWFKMDKI